MDKREFVKLLRQ